jgi:hypothetical protein
MKMKERQRQTERQTDRERQLMKELGLFFPRVLKLLFNYSFFINACKTPNSDAKKENNCNIRSLGSLLKSKLTLKKIQR